MNNFISNSLKFTLVGFIKVKIKLINQIVKISIKDSGTGIEDNS